MAWPILMLFPHAIEVRCKAKRIIKLRRRRWMWRCYRVCLLYTTTQCKVNRWLRKHRFSVEENCYKVFGASSGQRKEDKDDLVRKSEWGLEWGSRGKYSKQEVSKTFSSMRLLCSAVMKTEGYADELYEDRGKSCLKKCNLNCMPQFYCMIKKKCLISDWQVWWSRAVFGLEENFKNGRH